ncbi:MAG: protein phosphatase 2C domain-containing protein [Desulfobacterales bacterium]|jgi:protein phosphatase
MVTWSAAGLSDVGKKRKTNEDAFVLDTKAGLFVVADGMGGRRAGEVASRLVIEHIGSVLKSLENADSLKAAMTPLPGLSDGANRLVFSVLMANKKTHEHALAHPECKGMGTTLAAVYLTQGNLVICNVGDSPVFLFRNGTAELLSTPHTVMAEQASIAPPGGLKLGKQYLHMITRAMGIGQTVEPDVKEIDPLPGDVLVICSDGLSDKAFPEELAAIASASSPEDACRRMVALANERGGDDNITVIVIAVGSEEDAPSNAGPGAPVSKTDDPHVIVEVDTEDASYRTLTRSLRIDGVFLAIEEPFVEGEDLMLTVIDPMTDETIMLSGIVTGRTVKGVDIAFYDLTSSQLEALKALVRNL